MFFRKREKKDYFYLIEKHLQSGDCQICSCGESSIPTEKDIRNFERVVGYKLPNDFREYSMTWLGGLYVAAKEDIWPRAKLYDVGPFWTFLYGLIVYGFASDIPEWMDIRKKYEELKLESEGNYVPFLSIIGDADIYCFDKDQKIFKWSHETNEVEIVDKNFVDLLDYELGELADRIEKRKTYKKD